MSRKYSEWEVRKILFKNSFVIRVNFRHSQQSRFRLINTSIIKAINNLKKESWRRNYNLS